MFFVKGRASCPGQQPRGPFTHEGWGVSLHTGLQSLPHSATEARYAQAGSQPASHSRHRRRPGRYSHPPHALVHAGLVHQHHDLRVGEVGVLLRLAQLLDLDVGQLHLLLRVYHLGLQLGEGLGGRAAAMRGGPDRPRPAGPTLLRRCGGGRTGPGLQGRRVPGRHRPRDSRENTPPTAEGVVPSSAPGPRAPPSCLRSAPARWGQRRHRAQLRMREVAAEGRAVVRAAGSLRGAGVCRGVPSRGGTPGWAVGSLTGAGAPGRAVGDEAFPSGVPGPATSAGVCEGEAPRGKPGESPAGLAMPCGPGCSGVPRAALRCRPSPAVPSGGGTYSPHCATCFSQWLPQPGCPCLSWQSSARV